METIRISASQHAREEHNQLISSINTHTNNQTNDDSEQQQQNIGHENTQQPNNNLSLHRQATVDNTRDSEDTTAVSATYGTGHSEHYITAPHVDHQQTNHYAPGTAEVCS